MNRSVLSKLLNKNNNTKKFFSSYSSSSFATTKATTTTTTPLSGSSVKKGLDNTAAVARQLQLLVRHFSQTTINREDAPSLPSGFVVSDTLTAKDGKQYALLDISSQKKLKPSVVRRRLEQMRTYIGRENNIRHSPWKMNLICRLIAGMPVSDAQQQLLFCEKGRAPTVANLLRKTVNLADIRDGLQPSQLEVAECFATQGKHLKRMKIMSRGRTGIMHHKHCHVRLVLREIDFSLKIWLARTAAQKKKWVQRRARAEEDGARGLAEREELEALERAAREQGLDDENDKK